MQSEQLFGKLVRERRQALGLSQVELAGRVGCATVTERKIETGDLRPSIQMAERLALALAIPSDEQAEFVHQARSAGLRTPDPPRTPTPTPSREEIGQQNLSGRAVHGYELGERIGAGGFGVVYRAIQPVVERDVAIKIILPEYANHPDFIRRFESEARLVARLEHPHIVPLYDYWREPGAAYLVMRLLRGGSLRDLLGKGPLALEQFVRMIEQIGAALHSAHRYGVIHRDLKPANILLDEDQNTYLADFGIAKNLGSPEVDDQTRIGAMVGSPAYASPEQIRCEGVRPQSDIYCLGILMFEMLCGNAPFQGPTPVDYFMQHFNIPLPPMSQVRPELPAALDGVLQRAAAKKAEERYEDVPSLLVDLHAALSGVAGIEMAAPSEATGEIRNPYKGLSAFGEADADDFFGREALIRDLLGRMSEENDLSRFLAVVGPSGSGKSSVVRAGLAPALRRGGLPGSENWFITSMTPGAHPLEELEAALLRVAVNPPASLLSQLQESERGLLRAVRRILPEDGVTELVLIIDQFEELFTLTESEPVRAHFLASLLAAVLEPDSRLHMVITMRADFTDRPLQYVDFGELVRQRTEFVLPLTPDELEQAVTGPARRGGLVVEPGLVARIVHDVGDQPGALPLLQYALTELYEQRDGRRLTQAAYQEIGGIGGALAQRAEQIYGGLSEAEQKAARQMLLRLVTLGEGTEDTRRRVLRTEIEALSRAKEDHLAFKGAIEKLGQYRLLTFDHDPATRAPTVEVAHEALLDQWPRLRRWLTESRAELRMQRLLGAASAEWQAAEREESFLLRGSRLDQFSEWAEGSSLALTPLEDEFLQASLANRQAHQAAELARQAREAALEQRSRRFLRGLAAALGAAALIALVFSLLISQQWRRAEDASQQALAGQQTAEAASAVAATEKAAAVEARNEAEEQRVEAEAQRIIAEQQQALAEGQRQAAQEQAAIGLSYAALRELDSGYQHLGVLLALEALENFPYTWQAELALSQAVQQSRLRVALPHDESLVALAWSPSGDRLATASRGRIVKIWDAQTWETLFILPHGEDILSPVYWSPDGSRLVTQVGLKGRLVMWDTLSGLKLYEFGHADWIYDVAWSPSGERLVSIGNDSTARVWNAGSGQELFMLEDQPRAYSAVTWSPDGERIVTSSAPSWDEIDRTEVVISDANTGKRILVLPGYIFPLYMIDFSPSGERFVAPSGDGAVRVWNLYTGEEELVFQPVTTAVQATWSPDGNAILTQDAENIIMFWDANTGEEITRLLLQHRSMCAAEWSPDGLQILTAYQGRGLLEVWNAGGLLYSLRGHKGEMSMYATGNLCGARWAPDGRRIASANKDGTAMVWDARPVWELISGKTFPMGNGFVLGADWTDAGDRFLAASGRAKLLRVWDSVTYTPVLTITAPGVIFYGAEFSHAGDRIATGSMTGRVHIWDAVSGQLQLELQAADLAGRENIARTATWPVWSPDDQRIATGSDDGLAKIWDAQTGELLLEYTGHKTGLTYRIWDLQWLPDQAAPHPLQIVTAGADQTVQFWDPFNGEKLRTLTGFLGAVIAAQPSPDNRQIATYSEDGLIRIWEAGSGELLRSFPSNLISVYSLAWNPAGTRLVISNNDGGDLRVLDALSGAPLHHYFFPPGASTTKWSPDGKQLLVAGFGQAGLLPSWNNVNELIAYAKDCCAVGELSPEDRRRFGLPVDEAEAQPASSTPPAPNAALLVQPLVLLALAAGLWRLRASIFGKN